LLSAFASVEAYAAEPALDDTAAKPENTPPRAREIAVCLWQSNKEAALALSGQEMALWKDKSGQFRVRPADFAVCGVGKEQDFLANNVEHIAINLHMIRSNQAARCVVRNGLKVFDIFDKLVADKSNMFVGRFANLSNESKRKMVLQLGIHLPDEVKAAASSCDADVGAWADLDESSRVLFAEELVYEAKRNA